MKTNSYHVIGLMSGTSLDGVDLAYCIFTYENRNWIYKILNTATFSYSRDWEGRLSGLMAVSGQELIATDHAYGRYLGELVKEFITENNLKPDFISSHGHTVFHQPEQHISLQVGNGAYLAAVAGLPVVCDFRTVDIALSGQGAPLVPIGHSLLFPEYNFCLNLGGISNISFEADGRRVAYDIGACNMLLNNLAIALNLPYDINGDVARSGNLDQELFTQLNAPAYFTTAYPKSLGKEWVDKNSLQAIAHSAAIIPDKLHTACRHIAYQIAESVKNIATNTNEQKLLVTGGGALNIYLIELIADELGPNIKVVVPEPELINFNEALIFALLAPGS